MARILDQITKKLRFHQGELQSLLSHLQPEILEVEHFVPETKCLLGILHARAGFRRGLI